MTRKVVLRFMVALCALPVAAHATLISEVRISSGTMSVDVPLVGTPTTQSVIFNNADFEQIRLG